ncbi:hypothetical protein N665_0562s0015, partial [Sinapis alba]
TRTCSFCNELNWNGNVSLILLLSTFRTSRAEQLVRDKGSFPSNRLWLTSSDLNSSACMNMSGILPLRLLLRRFRSSRELIAFPKHRGMEPWKLLFDRSMRIFPWKAFDLRSNVWILLPGTAFKDPSKPDKEL